MPYVSTGLPHLWREWIFRNKDELNSITIVGYTRDFKKFAAQKLLEENGSTLWGEEGKLWKPPNYDKIWAIITPNGKGGVFIFYKYLFQELDKDGNYVYDSPITVLDTTLFKNEPYPVSGEYAEGQGAFVLYTNWINFSSAQVILQKIAPDGDLPWGKDGIIICDTTVFLNSSHSLLKINPELNEAFIFVRFHAGIFVTKVDLTDGSVVTSLNETNHKEENKPRCFQLSAYPNPFVHSTNIVIKNVNDKNFPISLKIYNLLGKEVMNYADRLTSDASVICWDGKDLFGRSVAAGLYFAVIKSCNNLQIHKLVKIH